jgi:hypothetical protein
VSASIKAFVWANTMRLLSLGTEMRRCEFIAFIGGVTAARGSRENEERSMRWAGSSQ